MNAQFQCPSCGRSLAVSESLAGTSSSCPYCRSSLRVPKIKVGDAEDTALQETSVPRVPAGQTEYAEQDPSHRKTGRRSVWLILLLVGTVLATVVMIVLSGAVLLRSGGSTTEYGSTPARRNWGSATEESSTSKDEHRFHISIEDSSRSRPGMELPDLIALVEPAVVRIKVETQNGESGFGSGFVVDRNGLIITNYHVIKDLRRGTVIFPNGVETEIEGYIERTRRRDLAVIFVSLVPEGVSALPLCSTRPTKGETVVAFGSPLSLSFTASDGIVSAVRSGSEVRQAIIDSSGQDSYYELNLTIGLTWIQTTAPISPGNSGGPLINEHGQVVGINTLTFSAGQNLNFAVTSTEAIDLIQSSDYQIKPF